MQRNQLDKQTTSGWDWGISHIAAIVILITLGLMGVDRWFYEAISLRFNTLSPVDHDLYHQSKVLWNLFRLWPHLAGAACCYLAVFAFTRRGFRKANACLVTALFVALLAHFLQCGIGRARPNQADSALTFRQAFDGGVKGEGVGLPSGEAATATALSIVLGCAFPRRRAWFLLPTFFVILARLLPGMHYLSDVLAGYLLAMLISRRVYLLALQPPSALRRSLRLRLRMPARVHRPTAS